MSGDDFLLDTLNSLLLSMQQNEKVTQQILLALYIFLECVFNVTN